MKDMKTHMKFTRLMVVLFLASISCAAQSNPIADLLRAVLSSGSASELPAQERLFSTINENTVGALSVAELNAILPLAKQCLQSSRPQVGAYGLVVFLSATMRPDSARLLLPYVDDLGTLLDGPENKASLRHAALYVLGSTKPNILPKAIALLNAHLEDGKNSTPETLTIAASLLAASPADAATQRKIFAVVARNADLGLRSGVVRQLGLSKVRTAEALSFLDSNLNHPDINIRESAVDAVSRLDADVRSRFAPRLAAMASDPNQSEHARSLARMALQP